MEHKKFVFPFLNWKEILMEAKVKSHELRRRTNKRLKVIGKALNIDQPVPVQHGTVSQLY